MFVFFSIYWIDILLYPLQGKPYLAFGKGKNAEAFMPWLMINPLQGF